MNSVPPLISDFTVLRFSVDPPGDGQGHVVECLRRQYTKQGLSGDLLPNSPPEIPLPPEVEAAARSWLREAGLPASAAHPRPLVALHAGSGSPLKRWPLECYIELARWLQAQCGAFVLNIVGPADLERQQSSLRLLQEACAATLEGASLELVGALLRHCHLYLGNDSGISHLAAAVGCPSVTLFGVTDWRRWGSQGDHVTIIAASDVPPPPDWRRASPAQAEAMMRGISFHRVCEVVQALDRRALTALRERRLRGEGGEAPFGERASL